MTIVQNLTNILDKTVENNLTNKHLLGIMIDVKTNIKTTTYFEMTMQMTIKMGVSLFLFQRLSCGGVVDIKKQQYTSMLKVTEDLQQSPTLKVVRS